MSITQIISLIALLGGFGGIINSAMSGEFGLPHFDRHARVWRPGWLGNVLVGAAAAVVVWGVYGPLASYDLANHTSENIHLTVSQLLVSIVIGLSGGKILTLMAEKQAARVTQSRLGNTIKKLTDDVGKR